MNVVATLEVRYLPLLNQLATRLGEKHPTFKVNIGSGSIGGATTFQGHDIYLEAFRPDKANHEPNCLALEICVRDLPGTPTLCTLSVGWGGDGIPPTDGLDLLPADVVFGPDALRIIDEALPRLEDHFDRCLCDWEAAYPQSTYPWVEKDAKKRASHPRRVRQPEGVSLMTSSNLVTNEEVGRACKSLGTRIGAIRRRSQYRQMKHERFSRRSAAKPRRSGSRISEKVCRSNWSTVRDSQMRT